MGVDMKVKAIYDSEIGNITRSEKNWKAWCERLRYLPIEGTESTHEVYL